MTRPLSRLLLYSLVCLSGVAQTLAITEATVIDPRSRLVLTNPLVVVQANRIESVERYTGRVLLTATEIQAKGRYLIPGLWDNHVYLSKAGELAFPRLWPIA